MTTPERLPRAAALFQWRHQLAIRDRKQTECADTGEAETELRLVRLAIIPRTACERARSEHSVVAPLE